MLTKVSRPSGVLVVYSLCLVIIGIAVGWLPVLILAAATLLVRVGYQLAFGGLCDGRARVKAQRQALDAEWRALDDTRRVRVVLLDARRAMQAEARAACPTNEPNREV